MRSSGLLKNWTSPPQRSNKETSKLNWAGSRCQLKVMNNGLLGTYPEAFVQLERSERFGRQTQKGHNHKPTEIINFPPAPWNTSLNFRRCGARKVVVFWTKRLRLFRPDLSLQHIPRRWGRIGNTRTYCLWCRFHCIWWDSKDHISSLCPENGTHKAIRYIGYGSNLSGEYGVTIQLTLKPLETEKDLQYCCTSYSSLPTVSVIV